MTTSVNLINAQCPRTSGSIFSEKCKLIISVWFNKFNVEKVKVHLYNFTVILNYVVELYAVNRWKIL